MKKQILYVGNFVPPFSTENDIKKSFEALGWEVTPIQERELTDQTVNWIISAQTSYDFILYTRTWAEVSKQWRKVLKAKKVPIVSVHLDLYIGLDRGNDLKNDPFFLSDYVFSADGGHQEEFKAMGIHHFFFPPAVLHTSCYLGEKERRFEHDVIFVGSHNYHAEWPYRPALIGWLRSTYGSRFTLYPNGGHAIRGDELNRLYSSAKVIVGDSTFSPNYWSDRIPETLGRGGFLIHPRVPGLEDQFEYYKHLIPYFHGDFKGLKEIIDYYIQADEEREQIRLAGMEHVKQHHTYIHRVEMIINKLKTDGKI
jgi:hypothetical protein